MKILYYYIIKVNRFILDLLFSNVYAYVSDKQICYFLNIQNNYLQLSL